MNKGWRYRIAGVVGTATITATTVVFVNNLTILSAVSTVPVLGRLPAAPPHGSELVFEMLTATAVVLLAFLPLFKPRPRRILDVASIAGHRVMLAIIALAAVGYFDYTYRLPRMSVLLVTPVLLVALPAWFVYIRRQPGGTFRAVVVGDDPAQIERVVDEVEVPLFGYLCPTRVPSVEGDSEITKAVADGGRSLGRIGGLSRLEQVLLRYEIDTVFLAFDSPDRAEFFGALDTCYEHGISARVHRKHSDSVLTATGPRGTFVDVDIEPWDIQDYVLKRTFDIIFATVGMVIAVPLLLVVAAAVKLDDRGPVFYRQERTAVFGETFEVYKIRTMNPGRDSPQPVDDSVNSRITSIGRVLRPTHLDEIPQLWSVFIGDMSVVGPRAVWREEETLLEEESDMWRKRWFVKPGLTGLAQVEDAKSSDPEEKLRLDLEYVRRQSLRFDMKIVVRQLWKVFEDMAAVLRSVAPDQH